MQKRGLTRQLLLQAAIDIVETEGTENLTVCKLAQKVSVKPASLYNHIRGINDIKNDVVKHAANMLEEAVMSASVGKSKDEALLDMALNYRKYAHSHPELYKLLMGTTNLEDANTAKARRSLIRVLNQVLIPYQLSDEKTVHFIRSFRSTLHGFVSLEATGYFKTDVSPDESFIKMIEGQIILLHKRENES